MQNKLPNHYIIILTILIFSIIFIIFRIDIVTKNISKEIQKVEIQYAQEYSSNISKIITEKCGFNLTQCVKSNPKIREELNKILTGFATNQFKYVYVVTLDKNGKFRYLLDGSKDINERGLFWQNFIPESSMWNEAYNSGAIKWSVQNNVSGVWLTFLYPIQYENKTNALIAMDISIQEFGRIIELVSPVKSLLIFLMIILIIAMLVTIFQTYMLYKTHNKSIIDPLTGLFNRNFLNNIKNKFKLKDYSTILVDIDYFKKINDTYGHDFGDKVLIEFSNRLKDSLRNNDYIIRYGGEEFLIFLNHKNNFEGIIKALKRTKERISNTPFNIDTKQIEITASFGVNLVSHLSRNIEQAILIADKMLYLAKTNGRNRIEIYDDKHHPSFEFFSRMEDVLALINKGNIEIFYQPILNLNTNKIEKFEALARLVDNNNNIIPPHSFIPIIKKSSAYRLMSKIVIENAFNTIKTHNTNININFDVGDFLDDTLFEMLMEKINNYKDITSFLTIELLEDQPIRNFDKIYNRIKSLKNTGVKIALDDFGSGYSNYDYLVELKPDLLKIDGSLIKNITSNSDAYKIVQSIQNICNELSIETTAEFVENKEILCMIEKANIKYAQGYFIGKPQKEIDVTFHYDS